MIFLGPLYDALQAQLADHINHFPLIRLVVLSLDKTLLYLALFLVYRVIRNSWRHGHVDWWRETRLVVFTTYLLLLLFLTVFRGQYYFPWQLTFHWNRPLAVINWEPLVETMKLRQGLTQFDFYYQSLGNVAWFVPFGLLVPTLLRGRGRVLRAVLLGSALSLAIETLQFFLITGVSDIDDWLFNTAGVILGCCLYGVIRGIGRLVNRPSRPKAA